MPQSNLASLSTVASPQRNENPQTQADIPDDWFREDGSLKGVGFLGPLQMPNGGVASEFSIADSRALRDAKGGWLDYPSIVPTLTKEEVQAVLRAASDPTKKTKIPDAVYKKAEAFALQRRAQGLPLFARPDEARLDLHPELSRQPIPAFVSQHYGAMQGGSPDPLSIAVGAPAEGHTNYYDMVDMLRHGTRPR